MFIFQPKSLISIASKCIVKNYNTLKSKLHILPQNLYTCIYKYNYRINKKRFNEIYYTYHDKYNNIGINRAILMCYFKIKNIILDDACKINNNPVFVMDILINRYEHKEKLSLTSLNIMQTYFLMSNMFSKKPCYIFIVRLIDDKLTINYDKEIFLNIKNIIDKSPLFEWKCIELVDIFEKKDSIYI